MRAVDKKKHEHLISCLEELRLLAPECNNVEADINALTDAYKHYSTLLNNLVEQTESYYDLYTSIQVRTYKELRVIKKLALKK